MKPDDYGRKQKVSVKDTTQIVFAGQNILISKKNIRITRKFRIFAPFKSKHAKITI